MVSVNTTNLDRITAFLRSKGESDTAIAGIEGNLQIESGFDPTALNRREGAIGLAQWENGRRTALQHHAASMGLPETSLDAQLSYLWAELSGPESAALTALNRAGTPAEAAAVFDQKFERSAGTSRGARVDAANAIAARGLSGGGGAPASSSTGASSTGAGSSAGAHGITSGGGTGSSWLDSILTALVPGGGLIANVDGGQGLITAGFAKIGGWLVDALFIILGAALVITAVVLVAKGGEGAPTVTLAAPGRSAGKRAGASGAAEDAAETAAVA